MRRTRLLLVVVGVLLLLGSACGGEGPDGAGADDADAATAPQATAPPEEPGATEPPVVEPELVVGATLPPIASLVEHVGGDRVAVHSLVPAGRDSHTYEPTPADARALDDAAAYFGVGLQLNEAALQLAEQTVPAEAPVVRLAEVVVPDDEVVFDHDHDDGHTHDDDGHTHDDDGHTHDDDGHGDEDDRDAGPNAHVWLDVAHAIGFVEEIRDTLVDVDPDGSSTYQDNAAAAVQRLEALDAVVADAVASIPPEQRTMVVYHDAWSYFGERYDLEVVAAVQPSDFSEPSAADVRAIIDQIREEDVPAVFGSEVFPSRVLQAIADETGAEYVGDLADDALPGAPGQPEHSYEGMMLANVRAIVGALGGDTGGLEDSALLPGS